MTGDGRSKRGDATRSALIRLATELFADRGYEATSIEAVLARSGISRGALYHHYGSKQDLFEAVFNSVEEDIGHRVQLAAAGASSAVGALQAGSLAWIRLAGDPVVRRIVLIDAPSVLGWQRWRETEEAHALGLIKHALQTIAEEGRLSQDLVDMFAHVLLASLNEITLVIASAPDLHAALISGERAVGELLARLLR
ncbi:MAG: TetR/AcrR family transcriptional regulator [Actinomycetota bacterium]|nr:TetR/AcrR family transcriptional regulator [Actinomycetota bacterium]